MGNPWIDFERAEFAKYSDRIEVLVKNGRQSFKQ